jgi:twitching motility protein PilT
MRQLGPLVGYLRHTGVVEVALAGGRLPCVLVDGSYRAIEETPITNDEILALLYTSGGSRHVDRLGEQALQWSFRLEAFGRLNIAATSRGGAVQVRIRLADPAMEPADPVAERAAALPPPSVVAAVEGKRWDASSLEAMLRSAREIGATDLHVVSDRPALVRVAGRLEPIGDPLAASFVEALSMPTIPARLRESFRVDGTADYSLEVGRAGRVRANLVRQRTGLKLCMRMIPEEVPTIESLGLPSAITKALRHHQGLIVIAGPTGHGKTTTMAALVRLVNEATRHHVITVEDPIEYVHPARSAVVSQREVGSHTRSFGSALKASLREDPDVIVVGELRDTETVRMALNASETGHLVLGTMNTPSAAKTIDRLVDLFPPGEQPQVRLTLAGGLKLIVAQRLVPRADASGVVAAVEILPGIVPLWNLIREQKTYQIASLQQRGRGLGIVRLDESLLELVKSGTVTREAALEHAENPAELEAILDGRAPTLEGPAPPPQFDARQMLPGNLFRKNST